MTSARDAIDKLKGRVSQRERGSVIVDGEGNLHDPNNARNVKGKKVKPIVHGGMKINGMVRK